jgi:hypothetical protein
VKARAAEAAKRAKAEAARLQKLLEDAQEAARRAQQLQEQGAGDEAALKRKLAEAEAELECTRKQIQQLRQEQERQLEMTMKSMVRMSVVAPTGDCAVGGRQWDAVSMEGYGRDDARFARSPFAPLSVNTRSVSFYLLPAPPHLPPLVAVNINFSSEQLTCRAPMPEDHIRCFLQVRVRDSSLVLPCRLAALPPYRLASHCDHGQCQRPAWRAPGASLL